MTTATPELDRLAAALHAHRLRRSGGRIGDWHQLDGTVRHALRNEVLAVIDAFRATTLLEIALEKAALWPPSKSPPPSATRGSPSP